MYSTDDSLIAHDLAPLGSGSGRRRVAEAEAHTIIILCTNTVDTNTFVTKSTRRVAEAKAKAIIIKLEFENILAARLMRRWE